MILVLNHKSNITKDEMFVQINQFNKIKTEEQIIIAPSFINIQLANNLNCELGAQNVSKKNSGAYTGEVSAEQLKSYGVKYCLVGHSERRSLFQESNEDINEKIKRLLEQDIIPILCIGESKSERKSSTYKETIQEQLETATLSLTSEEKDKLIIAYEPIWSIGTGQLPTKAEIEEVVFLIEELLPYSDILYGGSVNEENIMYLKQIKTLDGFLIGGASLSVNKIEKILNIVK